MMRRAHLTLIVCALSSCAAHAVLASTDPGLTVSYATACPAAPPDLVGYWRFNGDTGDLAGPSDLVLTGAVEYQPGPLGEALHIGSACFPAGHLTTPATSEHDVLSTGFAIEFWYLVQAAVPAVIASAGTPSTYWRVQLEPAGPGQYFISFLIANDANFSYLRTDTPSGAGLGYWHHVAFTYDGAALRVYVDGVLDSTEVAPSFDVPVAGTTLSVGDPASCVDLDELRIWHSARSAAQIASGMATEFTASAPEYAPGLSALWHLDGDGRDAFGGNDLVVSQGPFTPFGDVQFTPGHIHHGAEIQPPPTLPGGFLQVPAVHDFDLTAAGFTLECWVRPNGPGAGEIVRADSAYDQVAWHLHLTGDARFGFTVQHGTVDAELLSNTTVADGVWHHVAVRYDGTDLVLFLDGAVDASLAAPGLEALVGGGTLTLLNSSDRLEPFAGTVDEVLIWKTARPDGVIGSGPLPDGLRGLMAYWSFDGDATDAVSGDALTPIGNVTYDTGAVGLAAEFDTVSPSLLEGPAGPAHAVRPCGFTVEAMVKTLQTGPLCPLMIGVDAVGGRWSVGLDHGHVIVGLGGAYTEAHPPDIWWPAFVSMTSTATVNDGAWHHVALTYDGVDFRLYIDGESIDVLSAPGAQAITTGGQCYVGGGCSGEPGGNPQLDELRIWNVARSPSDLATYAGVALPVGVDRASKPAIGLWAGPTPSRAHVRIGYSLARSGRVSLLVHDIAGRVVRHLVQSLQEEGVHSVQWVGDDDSGRRLAAGVYWARLVTGEGARVSQLVMIR